MIAAFCCMDAAEAHAVVSLRKGFEATVICLSFSDGRCATIEVMNEQLTDGPRPPEPVVVPPEQRVSWLVPFVHVEDVERSIAFYYHLGFTVASVYTYKGRPAWAALRSEGAELMVTTGDPIDQGDQGVLFYLYSRDLATLREQLVAVGIDAGEIVDGTPGPRQELRLADPDGYVLMVAQIEPNEVPH